MTHIRPSVRRAAIRRASLAFCALLGLPGAAVAQEAATQRHVTLLGIPSATVAPHGLAFGSLAVSTRRLGVSGSRDGSAAVGLGFGSAEDGIGIQATANITSLTRTFGDSGYLELKAARRVSAGTTPTYLSLTLGGLAGWGDAVGRENSATVAMTQFRQVQFTDAGPAYPVMFTLGAGSHVRNLETAPGVFGGVGIGLTPNLGASAAWSGEYVNLGVSARFDSVDNLNLTATLYDAFDQKGARRLTVAAVYVLKDLF